MIQPGCSSLVAIARKIQRTAPAAPGDNADDPTATHSRYGKKGFRPRNLYNLYIFVYVRLTDSHAKTETGGTQGMHNEPTDS